QPPRRVRGDPGRIRQVLLNLLGNAVKFTEKGEVTLHLDSTSRDGRVQLRIEVVDTGIGLSDAEQENLFQPFMQADSSTTRRFGGTGLGLAISRQIIELMHGRIGVVSRPGSGCTFWIELSLEEVPASPDAPPAWADGLRGLLVDPNPRTRLASERALASWQVKVQAGSDADPASGAGGRVRRRPASEAAQAVAALGGEDESRFHDIVLVDHGLPVRERIRLVQAAGTLSSGAPKCILLLPFGMRLDPAGLVNEGFAS